MHIISGLYNVGLYGINQIRLVFGSIGVGEACPDVKVSCLDGLDPCGLDWESGGCMEVSDKCLHNREVVCAVGE